MLQQKVIIQHCVVSLYYSLGDLRARPCRVTGHGCLATIDGQILNRKATSEPLPRAITGEFAAAVYNSPTDGVIATAEILGGIRE